MARKRELFHQEGYDIHVVGGAPAGLSDAYHAFLRAPWRVALAVIIAAYFATNALFAGLYVWSGGLANAAPGSFLDAFFFSVQTMGTIGYGAIVPTTRLANAIVVLESVVALLFSAIATGLVFARFSQTRARVIFSSKVAIGPLDGARTLMIRVGNERRNRIINVSFRLTMARTTRTAEGKTFYRTVELPLVRDSASALSRSWSIMHTIDEASPLRYMTPEALREQEVELTAIASGTDETTLQATHALKVWTHESVVFDAQLADVLTELPNGDLVLDLTKFHEVVPVRSTEALRGESTPG